MKHRTGPMSSLKYGRKFNNFWSNVSAVKLGEDVPETTLHAIVEGVSAVELPEVKR